MDIASLLQQYREGAAQLREAVQGLTHGELVARPVPGKWSILEVVCHISDFEPVYADRMKRILAEDQPPLRGGDPDQFAARLAYHQRDLEEELELIDVVRKSTARILALCSPEDFERLGVHSSDGPLPLSTYLKRIAGHIPHHLPFILEKRKALGV